MYDYCNLFLYFYNNENNNILHKNTQLLKIFIFLNKITFNLFLFKY